MRIVEWTGIGVVVLCLLLIALFARRELIAWGGGTIGASVRLTTVVPGRGWSPGIARFSGGTMKWYRVFSFSIRPKRVLHRGELTVLDRREPGDRERMALPRNWVILRCAGRSGVQVEIAMAKITVTGFLSWLESAPPGSPPRPAGPARPVGPSGPAPAPPRVNRWRRADRRRPTGARAARPRG